MKNKPNPKSRNKSLYFSDPDLYERFEKFCKHRNMATGHAILLLLKEFIEDLELQKDMMEVSLPSKEIKFV